MRADAGKLSWDQMNCFGKQTGFLREKERNNIETTKVYIRFMVILLNDIMIAMSEQETSSLI